MISKAAREKIKEFGKKGDTYTEIINKMYRMLKQKECIDMLMNTEGYMTIKEARDWTDKMNKFEGKK